MEHRHYGELPCTPISDDVCLIPHVDFGSEVTRYTFSHERTRRPDEGFRCEGTVRVGGSSHPCWEATGTLEGGDLTLSPSVLCTGASGCGGIHGWVRGGRWVPA